VIRPQQRPQRRELRRGEGSGRYGQVVRLGGERHEAEPERLRGRHDPQAGVGPPGRDRRRDRQVRRLLPRVSLDRRGRKVLPPEHDVEQHPRPRATLPVHVPDAGTAYIGQPADTQRIPGGHHQPLRPLHQPHHRHLARRRPENPVHVRQRVVSRSRVEQV